MEEFNIQENERKEEKNSGFWKGFFTAVVLCVAVTGVCLAAGFAVKALALSGDREETLLTQSDAVQNKLAKLETYIRAYFLDEIDDERMEDYLYYGLVAGLDDPYATYYNEEETQSMLDSSNGSYCGIGAVFSQNISSGLVTVSRVYEGFPAYEAGILPEDILYKVEGEEITGEDLTNVVTKIKGEEGTNVTISVLRDGEELTFTMERMVVEVPTVESKMLEKDGIKTGYVMISEFDGVTDTQFLAALENLEEQGMEQLVIDLRDNGGGSVDAVCNIADALLPEGLIMYTEYNDGERSDRTSDADCLELPMAVLINGNSASASEILAGALQDYGVATIVGTQSYGKGIVQSVLDLQDGTALKLTTAKYYTPNGHNIHGIGITPDVEIDLPDELKSEVTLSFEEDVQLQKAIEVLQK